MTRHSPALVALVLVLAVWFSSCGGKREASTTIVLDGIESLLREGRHEEARQALDTLIATEPDEPEPHAMLGRLCLAQRDLECARREFQAALTLDPTSYWGRRGLGGLLTMADSTRARGITLLESCAADRLGDITVLDILGRAYVLDQQFSKAADLLQRAVSNTPAEDPALVPRQRWLARARQGVPRAEAAAGLPNLVLIILDTLRADHLGCYGYARPTSPNIDRIAEAGVLFEAAWSQAPWTAASLASLFTGLYPSVHGLDGGITWGRSHRTDDLPFAVQRVLGPEHTTLAEVLRQRGYATAGFVSNVYANSIFGLGQGFDVYDDRHSDYANDPLHAKRRSTQTNQSVFRWIESAIREPFFLLVHYNDCHWPYAPPPPFDVFTEGYEGPLTPEATGEVVETFGEPVQGLSPEDLDYIVGLYDGEIRAVDHAVGELLGRLEAALQSRGSQMETIVVLTADHGEEFLDHGSTSHGYTLYEEQLHVPLLIHAPQRYRAGRIESPVRLIDVFETAMQWTAQPRDSLVIAPPSQGQSLIPLLTRATDEGPQVLGAEATYRGQLRALRTRTGKKLIRSDGGEVREFYDLRTNPKELFDGTEAPPEWLPGLERRLTRWVDDNRALRRVRSASDSVGGVVEVSPELQERLRSLGYIR